MTEAPGNDKERVDELLTHGAALDAIRTPWEGLWDELAAIVHPRRLLSASRYPQQSTPDRTKLSEAFDGTAMRANRTLANGQAARITPMGARWFALRPPEELSSTQSAVAWYQKCGEILARKLGASNFYNRAHEHYLDRGAFGTAALECLPGKNNRGLHFRSYPIGTYSIAHNDLDEVDTLTRRFFLNSKQIFQMFGEDTPECVRKNLADPSASLTPLEIRQTIRPRLKRDPRRNDVKNKAFESVFILVAEKIILREEGFDEFPIAVSRWEMWGDSPYGWAPSYLALPEASQVNFIEQMKDTLLEVSAFPRVLYPSNIKGDIDFRALGLTCYDPSNGHEPKEWLSNGRYDIAKDGAAEKRRAIEEAFFVPLFSAISQMNRSQATATEIRAIVSESRELFHPIFANLTREFQGPVLKRAFAILLRQGELPPPPPSVIQQDDLGGFISDPSVEYTSSMALALEQSQIANFADCINVLAPLAQSDPGAFDFLDTDKIGPAFFRYKGLPEEFIRSEEDIAAIRDGRAKAAQAQMLEQAAGAIGKAGGAQGIKDLASLAGQ